MMYSTLNEVCAEYSKHPDGVSSALGFWLHFTVMHEHSAGGRFERVWGDMSCQGSGWVVGEWLGGGCTVTPLCRDSRHARAPRSTMGEGNVAAARAAECRYGAVCLGLGIGHENKHGRPLNEPVCLPKVKTAVVSHHNGTGLGTAGDRGERPHSNISALFIDCDGKMKRFNKCCKDEVGLWECEMAVQRGETPDFPITPPRPAAGVRRKGALIECRDTCKVGVLGRGGQRTRKSTFLPKRQEK